MSDYLCIASWFTAEGTLLTRQLLWLLELACAMLLVPGGLRGPFWNRVGSSHKADICVKYYVQGKSYKHGKCM